MRIGSIKEWSLTRRITVIVVSLAVLSGLGVVAARAVDSGLPGDVAIRVGHADITKAQLSKRAALLEALYGIKDPGGSKSAAFRRDIAQAVAMSTVLDRAATARGITITDKSAQDTLDGMIKDQLGTSTTDPQTAFTDLLGQSGVTEAQVLAEVKRQQAVGLLFTDVTRSSVNGVTDAVAKRYYEQDPSRFATPEKRKLRNIVVATKASARQLLRQARRGTSFATLARQSSLDESTRAKGGSLGAVSADQLDTTYAKAAFSAPAGGLFGPIKTSYGWNVGQVVTIVPAASHAYADVSDQVLQSVRSSRAAATWSSWLRKQLRAAHVQYADAYRPAHPDALPSGFAAPAATAPSTASTPSAP